MALKIYQDDSGWRVGDGDSQVSQVFPTKRHAEAYVEKRRRSDEAFNRAQQYPGKIIPVEWLEEQAAQQITQADGALCSCLYPGQLTKDFICQKCGLPFLRPKELPS